MAMADDLLTLLTMARAYLDGLKPGNTAVFPKELGLSASPKSFVRGVSSEDIVRLQLAPNGLINSEDGSKTLVGVIDLRDPRMDDPTTGLRAKSKIIGEKYPAPTDHVESTLERRERERQITEEIFKEITATYGYFDSTGGKMVGETFNMALGNPVRLSGRDIDSLQCRHFAPIAAMCLHEAGIRTTLMHSAAQEVDPDGVPKPISYHAYLVTDHGEIIEANPPVREKANSHYVHYRVPMNDDEVTSKALVMDGVSARVSGRYELDPDDVFYGGHKDGKVTTETLALSQQNADNRIMSRVLDLLDKYDTNKDYSIQWNELPDASCGATEKADLEQVLRLKAYDPKEVTITDVGGQLTPARLPTVPKLGK
ncbi:MAG: hypothetical protein SFT92_02095 [Rickettsiales bacterium]|nr:hypothetical protein [Rickettsiales bacterium]